jgi:hypothetical protein
MTWMTLFGALSIFHSDVFCCWWHRLLACIFFWNRAHGLEAWCHRKRDHCALIPELRSRNDMSKWQEEGTQNRR